MRISVSAKGIIYNEGKVLLIEYCDEVGLHYNFPGGKSKSNISIKEELKDKIYKETKLNVKVIKLLFVLEYNPRDFNYEFGEVHKTQFQFLCLLQDPKDMDNKLEILDENQTGYKWVEINDLRNYNLLPRIQERVADAVKQHLDSNQDFLISNW